MRNPTEFWAELTFSIRFATVVHMGKKSPMSQTFRAALGVGVSVIAFRQPA